MLLIAMQRAKSRKAKAQKELEQAAEDEKPRPCWRAATAWEFRAWPWCAGIINNSEFGPAIIGVILINSAFMAAPHQGQSDTFSDVLEYADVVFTAIFMLEFLLKLTGLGGFKMYFADRMNIFDLSLLLLTFGSTIVTVTGIASRQQVLEVLIAGLCRLERCAYNQSDAHDAIFPGIANAPCVCQSRALIYCVFGIWSCNCDSNCLHWVSHNSSRPNCRAKSQCSPLTLTLTLYSTQCACLC